MDTKTQIVITVALVLVLVWLVRLVRFRQLRGKYAVYWIGTIFILEIFVFWPELGQWISGESGSVGSLIGFLLVLSGFVVLSLIHVAWELSRLEERGRILAEMNAQDKDSRSLREIELDDKNY